MTMTLFLNPVSYTFGILAFVVGMLTVLYKSIRRQELHWLDRTFCGGGLVLSLACMLYYFINGPYSADIWPLALLGGAGTSMLVFGVAALLARLWAGNLRTD